MNYLLALIALAALMIVLSTVVSTAVEFIHKILSFRRTGLQEMMRAMHDNVMVPMEEGRPPDLAVLRNNGRSKAAANFALAMTKNPAYGGGGRWWWPSNWPFSNIFQRRFERLSNRQFVQQLAQTEFGVRLAQADRSVVETCIERSVYEFERYGIAQRQFFRRRAKVFAGLSAVVFVATANINAIDIFTHLAQNPTALNRAITTQDIDELTTALSVLDDAQSDAVGAGEDALADAAVDIYQALFDLRNDQALPIGDVYYPYCAQAERSQALDPSCRKEPPDKVGMLCFDKTCLVSVEPEDTPASVFRLLSDPNAGIAWVLSIIATAGLLALGAPFWFDVFNRAAAIVAGVTGNGAAAMKLSSAAGEASPEAHKELIPFEIQSLTNAFLIAAGAVGVVDGGLWPEGGRVNDASREEIAAQNTEPTDGGAVG